MLVGGSVAAVIAVAVGVLVPYGHPWAIAVEWCAGSLAAYLLGMGGYMVYSSKLGKVRGRDRLLDLVPWDEGDSVLDVGCGRGLLLVAAARRVIGGRAVGVDRWQAVDQSGNRPEVPLENARSEGVLGRVAVVTADARQLPFAGATFNLVVSHWVVHNLNGATDRTRALSEMVRVLRPGGHVLVADIGHQSEYANDLVALGLEDVRQVASPWASPLLGAMTFGSFRPGTVVGRKPLA